MEIGTLSKFIYLCSMVCHTAYFYGYYNVHVFSLHRVHAVFCTASVSLSINLAQAELEICRK